MTSGIVPLVLALLSADPSPAAPPEAVALIARLARPTPARTAYTEVRFLHVLRRPLQLHGELTYAGPGRLGKRVDTPYRETTRIADGNVEVEREGRAPQQFALERAPELKALLGGFSDLLGGDAAALQQVYTIDLVHTPPNWTLTFTPRAPALARRLNALDVDGSSDEPRCFTLRQANGDLSIMLLGALAVTPQPQPPSAAALTALCRAPP
jgi:hypothetical protein